MYGLIRTMPDGEIGLLFPILNNFEASLVLTLEQQKSRVNQLTVALTKAFADKAAKTAAFTVLAPALKAAWPYVSDAAFDYACNMAVAFYKLHGANYAAAQQLIANQVDAEFPASIDEVTYPRVEAVKQRLKALGFLMPEARRVSDFNSFCTWERDRFYTDIVLPDIWRSPYEETYLKMGLATFHFSDALQGRLYKVAYRAFISAPAAEVGNVLGAFQKLLDDKRLDVLQLLMSEMENEGKRNEELRDVTLREAVCGVVAHLDDAADFIADVRARVWWQKQARTANCLDDTIAAIDAGVDFGQENERNKKGRSEIPAFWQNMTASQTRMLATAARNRHAIPNQAQPAAAQPSLTVSSAAMQPDRETLRAWSLEDLVRWIEGPVAGPGSKPLDVKAVVARSKASKPRVQPAQTKAPIEDEADTLTEDEVFAIGADGYAAAAAYRLAEIKGLIVLGTQLKVDGALLHACDSLTGALDQLANEPTNLEDAHRLLTQAEEGMANLRAGIAVSKLSIQQQERFFAALQSALANETLTPDRREGGQINCPLKAGDWGWVFQNYHQRLLVGARSLEVNGRRMRLDLDHALALYVTAGSESGYLFDVTVHLWRRYADKKTAPGRPAAANEQLPPMNTDDWYDTYTTCCVLHVPLAPH